MILDETLRGFAFVKDAAIRTPVNSCRRKFFWIRAYLVESEQRILECSVVRSLAERTRFQAKGHPSRFPRQEAVTVLSLRKLRVEPASVQVSWSTNDDSAI